MKNACRRRWVGSSFFFFFFMLLTVSLWALPLSQAGPPEALITSLPGQPNASFAQYAGYITVDIVAGKSFFYYFAEAEDPSAKPLTLWLSGGPGCSSVGVGGFTENGPFRVCATSGKLIESTFSWNKASNMLYLDSPAGAGWSYSNASAISIANDSSTAQDNFLFLQSWLESFPEYKGREFHIAGDSYAGGHYVPQLSSLIVDYIAENGTSLINLIGIAVGNPFLYGEFDVPEQFFFLWSHALISDNAYKNVVENCNFSLQDDSSEECSAAYSEVDRQVSDYIDVENVLIDVCLSPRMQQAYKLKWKHVRKHLQKSRIFSGLDVCIDDELTAYMNLREVQQAFHANVTGLSYSWSDCSRQWMDYDLTSSPDSMLPVLSHILKHGVSVLVYSGDADSFIPFSGTRQLVDQLASMNGLNTSIPYSAWFDGGQDGHKYTGR